MKIRQYIVTYRNPIVLHDCLYSIFAGLSDEELSMLEIHILNNHSTFHIDKAFEQRVTIHHNTLRPDHSTGHLARDWNAGLVHGFQDLKNPACDIVILNQHDIQFKPNYIHTLIRLHQRYDLVQFGTGDSFMSFTPQMVRRVGLFDERFNGIGFQEEDYFIRAKMFHSDKISINYPIWDHHTNKDFPLHNPIDVEDVVLQDTFNGYFRGDADHFKSMQHHAYGHIVLWKKWIDPKRERTPGIPSWIMYPYFEHAVETLNEQRYLTPRWPWPMITHYSAKTYDDPYP
jgi:hypothetical protein